jgi:hypothetical protein
MTVKNCPWQGLSSVDRNLQLVSRQNHAIWRYEEKHTEGYSSHFLTVIDERELYLILLCRKVVIQISVSLKNCSVLRSRTFASLVRGQQKRLLFSELKSWGSGNGSHSLLFSPWNWSYRLQTGRQNYGALVLNNRELSEWGKTSDCRQINGLLSESHFTAQHYLDDSCIEIVSDWIVD